MEDKQYKALKYEQLEPLELREIARKLTAAQNLVPAYLILDWLHGCNVCTPGDIGLMSEIADMLLFRHKNLRRRKRLFYTPRHSRESLDARLLSFLIPLVTPAGSKVIFDLIFCIQDFDLRLPLLMSWAAQWGSRQEWERIMNEYLLLYRLSGCSLVRHERSVEADPSGHILDLVTMDCMPAKVATTGRDPISILMSAYNSAKTIEGSIKSVLAQTHSEFELIVVDDASEDGTDQIILELAAKDNRIIPVLQNVNSGPYVSRNIALSHATGEFITTHDADDLCHPDRLRVQVESLRQGICKSAVITQWLRVGATGHILYHNKRGGGFLHGGLATMMYRKSVIEKIGYYDPVRYSGDTEFLFRLRRVYGRESVDLVKMPLVLAASREASLTADANTYADSFLGDCETRALYRAAWENWHDEVEPQNLYMPLSADSRPFPAPTEMLACHHSTTRSGRSEQR